MPTSSAGVAGQAGVRSRVTGWRARYQPDRRRPWHRLLLHSPAAVASLAFIVVVTLVAIAAPLVAPRDPEVAAPDVRLQEPSLDHPFGTDDLGRDVLSRLIYGARVSLLVGAAVTLVAASAGSLLGLLAGYYDRADGPIMRTLDGFMAFPGILLAIAIVVSLGRGIPSVILALAIVYIPVVGRLVRSTTLVIRRLPYVESARAMGLTDRRILWRYVFANSLSALTVQCTFIFAYSIIAEAALSFLGASVSPETPTWGNMLRDGQRLLGIAWWVAIFPGLALVLTVLTLNILGDALRDALDPRATERRQDGVVR